MTGTGLRGAPRSVVAVAAAAVLLLALPVLALVQRAPWSGLSSLLTRREVVDALGVSLVVSLLAAGIVLVLGTPLAWVLARVLSCCQWCYRR